MFKLLNRKIIITIVSTAFGAALIAACGQPAARSSSSGIIFQADFIEAASTACFRYREQARARRIEDDEFAAFLSQSCAGVLADLARIQKDQVDRISLGRAYLEALIELDRETTELITRRQAAGIYPPWPSRTGEFLMAHHLGIIDRYAHWRQAYLKANPA